MAITIALAGNPNCGKTTLFNQLTGSNGYVGNWPGVTVEKLEAPWRKNKDVVVTDLPGIYSLSPYSPEEVVSRDHLVKDRPSAVIDLVDVTNLERNLYLTTQVLECGLPTVVGLNMCDLLEKSGDQLDVDALSSELGCPVVKVSALRSQGLDQLMEMAESLATTGRTGRPPRVFSPRVEKAIQETADVLKPHLSADQPERWFAIKAFEGDEKALDTLGLPAASLAAIDTIRAGVEAELDDDAESIITTERYDWIEGVMRRCVVKAPKALTTSEKIDRVVTNRVLGLPIFVCVMVLVYYLAVSTVGTWGTDWANDGLFGDGWFLSPAAAQSYEETQGAYDDEDYGTVVDEYLAAADAAGVDTDGVAEAIESGDAPRVQAFAEAASAAGVTVPDAPLHDADGNFLDSEGNVVLTDAEDDPLLSDGQTLAFHDTCLLYTSDAADEL